jgi:hypothetical protein
MKQCRKCRETKPFDAFHLDRRSANQRQSWRRAPASTTATPGTRLGRKLSIVRRLDRYGIDAGALRLTLAMSPVHLLAAH